MVKEPSHRCRKTRRPRGRPPAVFIEDPLEERERGEHRAKMAMRRYERELREYGPCRIRKPVQADDEFDEGLVYVHYAGLIGPKAVETVRSRTLTFAEWLLDQRGARGPRPDAFLQVRLYRAIETVAAIRRARKLSANEPTPIEVRDTLALLEGEVTPLDTVKHRLQRLRPRLLAFKEMQKAEKRSRKAQRAAPRENGESGEVAPGPTSLEGIGTT